MVRSDDELIDQLRRSFTAATEGIQPRPETLERIARQLADLSAETPMDSRGLSGRQKARFRRPRRWPSAGLLSGALAAAVAIAVVLVAVLSLHGASRQNQTLQGKAEPPALAVGRSRIVARTSDPGHREGWALQESRIGPRAGCLRLGRTTGRRFIAVPDSQDGEHCTQTDATGHLFLNLQDVNALLPGTGWRSLYYGVLGPDAVSITYRTRTGHPATIRTGPDGAYLIVEHATCPQNYLEGNACAIGGTSRSRQLIGGAITKVTYRDGFTCQLRYSPPGEHVPGECSNLGFTRDPSR